MPHWVRGTPDAGLTAEIVMASDVASLLAMPRRTLRIVLFANEEFGASGATRYAQLETDNLAKHALAMEADTGAGPV